MSPSSEDETTPLPITPEPESEDSHSKRTWFWFTLFQQHFYFDIRILHRNKAKQRTYHDWMTLLIFLFFIFYFLFILHYLSSIISWRWRVKIAFLLYTDPHWVWRFVLWIGYLLSCAEFRIDWIEYDIQLSLYQIFFISPTRVQYLMGTWSSTSSTGVLQEVF